MKFEANTMLPVQTIAVKRKLLICCLVCGYWYTIVCLQLNNVITFTTTEEDDAVHQIKDLREYSKVIKQEVKLSSIHSKDSKA